MKNKTKQLLEENNQAEKALSQEGQKLLTDLVVYLRGSRASVWEQEQVRRDITQMLLDAEKRGEKVESVIGPDPKSFCDEVIGGAARHARMEKESVRPAGWTFGNGGPAGHLVYLFRPAGGPGRGKLAGIAPELGAVPFRRGNPCDGLLAGTLDLPGFF